ncbi:hypothetical protein [Shinella sp. M27]|uniref:hypothetical protein n=1 Tax=Shinella sp. M27 TaxID=3368614 RepID=UPI003BA18EFD
MTSTDSKKIEDGGPDLSALIEKLEKAEGPDRELDEAIWLAVIPGASRKNLLADHPDEKPLWEYHDVERNLCFRGGIIPSYTSSIDAAVSLAERVLPGWVVDHIGQDYAGDIPVLRGLGWCVELMNGEHHVVGQSKSLAIALVLATLRALQSKGGEA